MFVLSSKSSTFHPPTALTSNNLPVKSLSLFALSCGEFSHTSSTPYLVFQWPLPASISNQPISNAFSCDCAGPVSTLSVSHSTNEVPARYHPPVIFLFQRYTKYRVQAGRLAGRHRQQVWKKKRNKNEFIISIVTAVLRTTCRGTASPAFLFDQGALDLVSQDGGRITAQNLHRNRQSTFEWIFIVHRSNVVECQVRQLNHQVPQAWLGRP